MSQLVLTTGANSGIGLATAIELARRGFRSVGSVRSEGKAKIVAKAAKKAGVHVETVLLDVTNAADCDRAIDELKPWGLVNNAGFPATGAVEDIGDDEARAALETMVIAPIRLARLSLRHMREARDGRIINISSIYGRTTTPLSGWYQAAKHALEALSDALRAEVASAGIKIILVEPGAFRTGIWEESEKAVAERQNSHYRTAYQRSLRGIRLTQPLMGNPQGVANIIARAMTAWYPRARYLVGYDAQMIAIADRMMPTPVKDFLSRVTLGL
jgi:NAD(P)-dependent dehydrogenase (short-subunit alcohol dehydrogenase family)